MKIKKFLFYKKLEITPEEITNILDFLPKSFSIFFLKWLESFLQEAEIFALFLAICEAIRTNKKIIKSESQFVVNSILKDGNIKEERLKLSILVLKSLIKHYGIDLVWIRREENLST